MSDHQIQFGILIVGVLTLIALVWYAIETWKLRKAAEEQLEALAKPCLTLAAKLRKATDAILSLDLAVGNTILQDDEGSFVLQNVGNGVALNIRYTIEQREPAKRKSADRSYLQNAMPGQRIAMPEPVNAYSGECELHFYFESIRGKKYHSVVILNNRVLTGFRFTTEK